MPGLLTDFCEDNSCWFARILSCINILFNFLLILLIASVTELDSMFKLPVETSKIHEIRHNAKNHCSVNRIDYFLSRTTVN